MLKNELFTFFLYPNIFPTLSWCQNNSNRLSMFNPFKNMKPYWWPPKFYVFQIKKNLLSFITNGILLESYSMFFPFKIFCFPYTYSTVAPKAEYNVQSVSQTEGNGQSLPHPGTKMILKTIHAALDFLNDHTAPAFSLLCVLFINFSHSVLGISYLRFKSRISH